MKLRLISDLHIDININYPLDLHKTGVNDIFTLVAGDISGSPKDAVDWIENNLVKGAFISGNHDVYDANMPIEQIKRFFNEKFPKDSDITYFDSDVDVISKEIDKGILLVADVLYTDYALPINWYNSNGNVEKNMQLADPCMNRHGGMNDFKYGECLTLYKGANDRILNSKKNTRRLVPQWYLDHHNRAFSKITKIVEENPDKQIILMTHHGLSPQCLDANYNDDAMFNASYASNKEDWIKKHSNVKCIVSGHIHCRKSFKIGECLYVMNSLGYCNRHLKQYDEKTKKYEYWTPNCFIDTDTWTVEWQAIENEVWKKTYKEYNDRFMSLSKFFI